MKRTIDIPEPLYRQAQTYAVEQGIGVEELILRALLRELNATTPARSIPYFAWRKVRPGFQALLNAEIVQSGTDATEIISDDRNDWQGE
jgi:hypothetical protein